MSRWELFIERESILQDIYVHLRREGLRPEGCHCPGGGDIEAIVLPIAKHLRRSHPDGLAKAGPDIQDPAKSLAAMRLNRDKMACVRWNQGVRGLERS